MEPKSAILTSSMRFAYDKPVGKPEKEGLLKEMRRVIYTVTFNPSLDYTVFMDQLQFGGTNRSHDEQFFVGGKGFNVSMVLSRLGIRTTAIGFVGGFVGEQNRFLLSQRYFAVRLIEIK